MKDGRLRNLLDAAVPMLAAAAVETLLAGERNRAGARSITRMIAHVGGRDVPDAIEESCHGLGLTASREVLREGCNVSSPSVRLAPERALRDGSPDEKGD